MLGGLKIAVSKRGHSSIVLPRFARKYVAFISSFKKLEYFATGVNSHKLFLRLFFFLRRSNTISKKTTATTMVKKATT